MILVVDDERAFVTLLERWFARQHPHVRFVTATNGVRALALAQEHATSLSVILLDVRMAVIDGRVVAAELRRIAPQAVIIPCSGDGEATQFFESLHCAAPILKPSPASTIADRIMQAREMTAAPPPEDQPWLAAMCAQARILKDMACMTDAPVESEIVEMPRMRYETVIKLMRRFVDKSGERISRDIHQSLRILEEYRPTK